MSHGETFVALLACAPCLWNVQLKPYYMDTLTWQDMIRAGFTKLWSAVKVDLTGRFDENLVIIHLTLSMLLHYLKNYKNQILVDIQQTWIKMQTLHFEFTAFNSSMRVTVYAELCVSRIFKILSIQRHSYFLSLVKCGWLWKEPVVVWLRLVAMSTVPVSRNFFNSLLTPCFVQLFSENSSVNLFAVYLFKYKLFIKILSSSLNTML